MKWLKFSVIFQNDSFTHSFGKMTKSFMHFMKWLTCWIFCYTIWLFVSFSNRHIVKKELLEKDPLLFLQSLLKKALNFESSFRKELYKKYRKFPTTWHLMLWNYCWVLKCKPTSQIKAKIWVLPACQVSFKDYYFFASCCYYYLPIPLLWNCQLILLYFLHSS